MAAGAIEMAVCEEERTQVLYVLRLLQASGVQVSGFRLFAVLVTPPERNAQLHSFNGLLRTFRRPPRCHVSRVCRSPRIPSWPQPQSPLHPDLCRLPR